MHFGHLLEIANIMEFNVQSHLRNHFSVFNMTNDKVDCSVKKSVSAKLPGTRDRTGGPWGRGFWYDNPPTVCPF